MMRTAALPAALFLAVALAGCAGSDAGDGSVTPIATETPQIVVELVGAGRDQVAVTVHGLRPGQFIRSVFLVDPAGLRIPAVRFETAVVDDPGFRTESGGFGFGGFGGVSAGYFVWQGTVPAEPTVTTATRISVPDPGRYHATAAAWQVEVVIASPPLADVRAVVPAPPPVPVAAG